MNGNETKDEIDRCAIWDAIYNIGAGSTGYLSEITGLHSVRIAALVKHEWFQRRAETIDIAKAIGPHRASARVA